MVSSTLLLFVSIFLYVTPCVSKTHCEQLFAINIEKPFEVALGNSKNSRVFCGGTLITNFYVLTAAECVINRQPDEIDAFTAVKYLNVYDRFKLRAVDAIIVHALYNPLKPLNNNIALLRLRELLLSNTCAFDPGVNKGIVPQKNELDKILRQKQLQVRLSGFGITSEYKEPKSDTLLEFYTTIVDPTYCRKWYKKLQYNISDKHICTYDPSISVDSTYNYRISDVGGPLIVNQNVILGIALNMTKIALNMIGRLSSKTYYPMLFTNVSYYRDWIQHIISTYDENDLEMALITWNPDLVL